MQSLRKLDINAPDPAGPEAERHTPSSLSVADDSHADIPSPARVLQQRLLDDLNAEAEMDDGRRWAPRTTLMFCGGISLALWGAIAAGIAVFR